MYLCKMINKYFLQRLSREVSSNISIYRFYFTYDQVVSQAFCQKLKIKTRLRSQNSDQVNKILMSLGFIQLSISIYVKNWDYCNLKYNIPILGLSFCSTSNIYKLCEKNLFFYFFLLSSFFFLLSSLSLLTVISVLVHLLFTVALSSNAPVGI